MYSSAGPASALGLIEYEVEVCREGNVQLTIMRDNITGIMIRLYDHCQGYRILEMQQCCDSAVD